MLETVASAMHENTEQWIGYLKASVGVDDAELLAKCYRPNDFLSHAPSMQEINMMITYNALVTCSNPV